MRATRLLYNGTEMSSTKCVHDSDRCLTTCVALCVRPYAANTGEKIEAADKVKTAGNGAYKSGNLHLASKKYDKALRYVEHDQSFSDEEKVASKALKLSLFLNAAAVALKRKSWRDAQSSAGKALEIEGANQKALYRRAQAAAEIEAGHGSVHAGAVALHYTRRNARIHQPNI